MVDGTVVAISAPRLDTVSALNTCGCYGYAWIMAEVPIVTAQEASRYDRSSCVLWECSCHRQFPQSLLYFCKYCNKIKCSKCLVEEIAYLYCPACFSLVKPSMAIILSHRSVVSGHVPCLRTQGVTNVRPAPSVPQRFQWSLSTRTCSRSKCNSPAPVVHGALEPSG